MISGAILRAFDAWLSNFSDLEELDRLYLERAKEAADEEGWGSLSQDFCTDIIDPSNLENYIIIELEHIMQTLEVTVKFPKTQIEKNPSAQGKNKVS
jgi:hypothetical protein